MAAVPGKEIEVPHRLVRDFAAGGAAGNLLRRTLTCAASLAAEV